MAHSDTSITESQLPSAEAVSWLVYGFDWHGNVVFQTVEQAIFDDAVHGALAEAKTWGEFRRLLPEGEWETIEEVLLEVADYDLEVDQKHLWELDETPFDEKSQLPDYRDDDHAEQSIDEVVQEVLQEVHGVHEPSIPFFLYDIDDAEAFADALRLLGYRVEHTQFLRGLWFR